MAEVCHMGQNLQRSHHVCHGWIGVDVSEVVGLLVSVREQVEELEETSLAFADLQY